VSHDGDVNGQDIFTEDSSLQTFYLTSSEPPLQKSCYNGIVKVIVVLLNLGARKNFGDCELGTPIQAAIRGNH
jgi:hypothetical protein